LLASARLSAISSAAWIGFLSRRLRIAGFADAADPVRSENQICLRLLGLLLAP
jgi:hypothetical protein